MAMRRLWPARHPSPRKSPLLSSPTTASLPALDTTDSFTAPRLMNMTVVPASPCAKMACTGLVIRRVRGDTHRFEEVVCTDTTWPFSRLRHGLPPRQGSARQGEPLTVVAADHADRRTLVGEINWRGQSTGSGVRVGSRTTKSPSCAF